MAKMLDGVKLKDGREGAIIDVYEDGQVFLLELAGKNSPEEAEVIIKESDIETITYVA